MLSSQVIFSTFPGVSMSFLADTPILLIAFILFVILYVIVSGVLMYHWSEYGMGSRAVLLAETLFIIVSVALFVVAFLALNYY